MTKEKAMRPVLSILTHMTAVALLSYSASAQNVVFATNPQGSIQYVSGTAVAKVLNEKAGIRARVQTAGGSSTYIPMLNDGRVAFGFSNGLEALYAFEGTGTFEGRPNKDLRLVAMVFPLYLSLVVPADSPAKSVSDVKGLRIGAGFTSQNIMVSVQNALLANGGLDMKNMVPVPVPNANQATLDQGQGRIDVSTAPPGGGVAQRAHAALASRGGVRFLPMDESKEALERMRKHLPSAWVEKLAPAPQRVGIIAPTPVMAYPYFLIAGRETPDDVVYKVVKVLHENKKDLVSSFAGFNGFQPAKMMHAHSVPYHAGAARFYKENNIKATE